MTLRGFEMNLVGFPETGEVPHYFRVFIDVYLLHFRRVEGELQRSREEIEAIL